MWQTRDLHFAADHPAAAGHFPSDPMIPGALMLDEVVAAIAGDASAVTIQAAKFLSIVRPGARVNLRWRSVDGGAIKFECRLESEDKIALSGTLEIGPMQP
jgi:3-hydroxymyristoyl/3-hydroxydecanoyl-(acyl carrier protein) dehydratase